MRFAFTGGLAGLCQLGLLAWFTHRGWAPDVANVAAFLLAAQLNFLLSTTFTWRDRQEHMDSSATLWRRWLTFHGAIATMAVVNLLVYSAARHVMPVLASSAMGIAAAAAGNFLLGDRLIFRPHRPQAHETARPSGLRTTRTKEVIA